MISCFICVIIVNNSFIFLILDSNIDRDVQWELFEILENIMEETENENPMPETISQLPMIQEVQDLQIQSTPERELPCAQVNTC